MIVLHPYSVLEVQRIFISYIFWFSQQSHLKKKN